MATVVPRKSAGGFVLGAAPFVLCHLAALYGVLVYGVSLQAAVLAVGLYYVRMFGVTGGYHRYFSHRAFKTGRVFQFVLAFLAMTSAQKSVLWWGAHHRDHHKWSDLPEDLHSPIQRGFWYAHVGWLFDPAHDGTKYERIRDFTKFPELMFLDRFWLLPPILLGAAVYFAGGAPLLLSGFMLSTVFLWHGTFTINSLAHVFGRRRYPTSDDSRNSFLLSLITLGEGWHNNHHHYQSSARNGFYWWELDVTYLVLRGLAALGIVWDLRPVPERVLEEGRVSDEARRAGVMPPPFVPQLTSPAE